MRRPLGVLVAVLMLAAETARAAGGLLIVEAGNRASAGTLSYTQFLADGVCSVLNNRGAPNVLVQSGAVTTAGASNGTLATSRGTLSFDWVGHIAYTTQNPPLNVAVYDPRTLLHTATWPTKPQVWFFFPEAGCGTASNVGSDSTGTNDCYPSSSITPNMSFYIVGSPYVWKERVANLKGAVATNPRMTGWRPVMSGGVTPVSNSGNNGVKDADSLARSNDPDTVYVWVRERWANDPAAQVFCYAGAGFTSKIAIKVALSELDRITARSTPGGLVFTDRGRTCRKHGVVIARGNGTSSSNSAANFYGGGLFCPTSATCDLENQKAGRDSMKAWGITKYTVAVDPESTLTTNGAQGLAVWTSVSGVKFCLQPLSGAVLASLSPTTTRAGAAGRCIDPFGIVRRRTMFGTTPSLTPDCSADSGSIACNVSSGFSALEAVVPGRVDHAILPSGWDWSPQEWTRAGAGVVSSGNLYGGEDSLFAALWSAKCRVVLADPTALYSNVGISWTTPDGFDPNYASQPAGTTPVTRSVPVRWGGKQVGQINVLAARWEPGGTSIPWQESTHDIGGEFIDGDEMGKFYINEIGGTGAYWRHTFNVSTRVVCVQAGNIGGPGANQWPQFPAARVLKWMQMGFLAANSRLPTWADGTVKKLDDWDYLENITP